VTVNHAFGQTVITAPPKRVVSAGFTEHDDLLAMGVVPIATTKWYGTEPFAVWPWAQPRLGTAKPVLLNLDNGIQVDRIAELRPDLIVATNDRRRSRHLPTAVGDRADDPAVGRRSVLRAVEGSGHHHRGSGVQAGQDAVADR
jgi:ABC-type Fe3+-hydroxamate transport system substrate-binding protein